MANKPKERSDDIPGKLFGLEEIGQILEMLRLNDVSEFTLEREGEKIAVKRGSAVPEPAAVPAAAAAPAVPAVPAPLPPVSVRVAEAAPQEAAAPAAPSNLIEVKSPMVGTFYRRPAVDADPYVEVGNTVKKGDVLCIIEAMKLMNEIESEFSGKIVEICLDDAKMAEYGEVLFRIEPSR